MLKKKPKKKKRHRNNSFFGFGFYQEIKRAAVERKILLSPFLLVCYIADCKDFCILQDYS
jgi:hypothetical protein